jgi:hypothetical protein
MIASSVAPLVTLILYFVFGYSFGEGLILFWPGALIIGLNPNESLGKVVLMYATAILTNVALYTVVGAVLFSLARFESDGPAV